MILPSAEMASDEEAYSCNDSFAGRVIAKRDGGKGGAAALRVVLSATVVPRAATSTAASAMATQRVSRRERLVPAPGVAWSGPAAQARARRRSATDCQRFAGFLARQACTRCERIGGVAGARLLSGAGSSIRTAAMRRALLSALNGRSPEIIS